MAGIAEVIEQEGFALGCIVLAHMDKQGPGPLEQSLAKRDLFDDIEETATRLGTPLLRVSDPNQPTELSRIRDRGTNVVMSCSAPIFRNPFLKAFDGWVFNFHGSRRYRGRGGLTWCILNGLTDDAVALHWVDKGIDTGDVVAEEPFEWAADAYPIDMIRAQGPCFPALTRRFLAMLREGTVDRKPWRAERPYFPGLRTDQDGWIDWRWRPDHIEKCVRAFGWPYAGASALLEYPDRSRRTRVHVGRCSLPQSGESELHPVANGSILQRRSDGGLDVVGGGGLIHIESLRDGDDEVPAADLGRNGMRFVCQP